MFHPFGLPCPALVEWLLLCLIISCFATFGCCLLEVCSFVKGNIGEGELIRGKLEGSGKSGERKLWVGSITQEKNQFSVTINWMLLWVVFVFLLKILLLCFSLYFWCFFFFFLARDRRALHWMNKEVGMIWEKVDKII